MVSTENSSIDTGATGVVAYEIEFDNDHENHQRSPTFKVRIQLAGVWHEIDATDMAMQFASSIIT